MMCEPFVRDAQVLHAWRPSPVFFLPQPCCPHIRAPLTPRSHSIHTPSSHPIHTCPHRPGLRSFLADYGAPLMAVVWSAAGYIAAPQLPGGKPRQVATPNTWDVRDSWSIANQLYQVRQVWKKCGDFV